MEHTKFLGSWLDDKLNWKKHCENVQAKLSGGLFAMRKLKGLPKFLLKTVYYSLFDCHINYGILWGGTFKYLLNPIIVQQKKAIRNL